MISKIPIDTDKKIIERYNRGADFIIICERFKKIISIKWQ